MHDSDSRTREIRRSFSQLAHARLPWWVISLLFCIHVWIELGGGAVMMSNWYEWLGLTRDGVLSGSVWKLLSYGLLHGGWVHLAVNAVCVFLLGTKIEHIIGSAGLAKLLTLGVIGGGIGHVLLSPSGENADLLVGFSGAVVALLIWITTVSPESRMWPLPVSGRALGLGILIAEWFLAMVNPALDLPGFSLVGNWLVEQGMESWFTIGHACHFGGGMVGWLLARWALRPRATLKSLRRERARQEARNVRK